MVDFRNYHHSIITHIGNCIIVAQSGKFVSRNQDIRHAILMLHIYLLVNFLISGAQFSNFPVRIVAISLGLFIMCLHFEYFPSLVQNRPFSTKYNCKILPPENHAPRLQMHFLRMRVSHLISMKLSDDQVFNHVETVKLLKM